MKWVLVSQAIGEDYVAEMRNMVETFHQHNPDVPVITRALRDDGSLWQGRSNRKVQWLIDVFSITDCDLLWVDADARFRRKVELPEGRFVVGAQESGRHKRHRRLDKIGNRLATGTMLIRRCGQTDTLLRQWLDATEDTGSNETGLARVLRGKPLTVYCDLPRTFSSVCNTRSHNWDGKLQHDSAIVHWNRSRSVIGCEASKGGKRIKEKNWPPPENVRRAAKP